MASVRLGTSGWSYGDWRGPFYPPELARKNELAHASRVFNSLEVNRSFYSLLSVKACRQWYDQTPDDFVFSLKGSGFITHRKKLRHCETALANFFASGPLALEHKLGPIVWQLPASHQFDERQLEDFFALLPRTRREASKLASSNDGKPKHGTWTEVPTDGTVRHVLEARHESFLTEAGVRLLQKHGVALAVTDSPHWPYAEEHTTDFMYVRLHGSEKLYTSSYRDDELQHWAARIKAWQKGEQPRDARRVLKDLKELKRKQDVYVYFDNDVGARAPADARRLSELLVASRPRRARAV